MVVSPLVSVVIPTRNRRALLAQTVDSVLRQTYTRWELVVVDDKSDDDTWAWLQSINDDRVRKIHRDQHSERSKTRNIGFAASQGEYVLFLDDDDLLTEQALATHVAALTQHPTAVASIGSYLMFDADGNEEAMQIVRRPMLRNLWQEFLFGWMATAGHSLFRRSLLTTLGGWNEAYSFGEDHELWLRAARIGPIALLPEMVLKFRVHSGQVRPQQSRQLLTELRQRSIESLSDEPRARGRAVLTARELEAQAADCFERARAGRALYYYLRIAVLAPRLFVSPLTRMKLLIPALKCLFGNVGLRAMRGVLAWRRRRNNLDHAPSRF
mgnify:CR=1 FL=1